MSYHVWLVNGRTYEKQMEVFPLDCPWKRALNGKSSGQARFQVGDPADEGALNRRNLWPYDHWLVVEFGDLIVYAGIITATSYDWASKQVTVSHSDLWEFWDKRHVLPNRTGDIAKGKLEYKNLSPGTLAKRALEIGTLDTGGLRYHVPIVLPADVSGDVDRTIYGYNLESVQSILDEVMGDPDGPDLDFRPRWSDAGTLEWVFDVNAYPNWLYEWSLDAEDTPVKNFTYRVHGEDLVSHVIAAGEGTEVDMIVGTATSDPAVTSYPAFEYILSAKNAKTEAKAARQARGHLYANDAAVRQVDMTLRAAGDPPVSSLRLGATVRWKAGADWWLPSDWQQWRLVEFSGSLNDEVNLVFADVEGTS